MGSGFAGKPKANAAPPYASRKYDGRPFGSYPNDTLLTTYALPGHLSLLSRWSRKPATSQHRSYAGFRGFPQEPPSVPTPYLIFSFYSPIVKWFAVETKP
jgi:hypothetical protein